MAAASAAIINRHKDHATNVVGSRNGARLRYLFGFDAYNNRVVTDPEQWATGDDGTFYGYGEQLCLAPITFCTHARTECGRTRFAIYGNASPVVVSADGGRQTKCVACANTALDDWTSHTAPRRLAVSKMYAEKHDDNNYTDNAIIIIICLKIIIIGSNNSCGSRHDVKVSIRRRALDTRW